jgi:hypothetical protein
MEALLRARCPSNANAADRLRVSRFEYAAWFEENDLPAIRSPFRRQPAAFRRDASGEKPPYNAGFVVFPSLKV